MNADTLRYPIGKFPDPGDFDPKQFQSFIQNIEQFPASVVKEVGPLTPTQQTWTYRPEGWSIKQVIHHCADSHVNAFTRLKLGLTEERPTIKPYLEAAWAKHADYEVPIINSIKILEGIHLRWGVLLRSLDEQALSHSFFHPENGKEWSLYQSTALYSWHCSHHLAHIKQAIANHNLSN